MSEDKKNYETDPINPMPETDRQAARSAGEEIQSRISFLEGAVRALKYVKDRMETENKELQERVERLEAYVKGQQVVLETNNSNLILSGDWISKLNIEVGEHRQQIERLEEAMSKRSLMDKAHEEAIKMNTYYQDVIPPMPETDRQEIHTSWKELHDMEIRWKEGVLSRIAKLEADNKQLREKEDYRFNFLMALIGEVTGVIGISEGIAEMMTQEAEKVAKEADKMENK